MAEELCAFVGEHGPCGHTRDVHTLNYCWALNCEDRHVFTPSEGRFGSAPETPNWRGRSG